MNPAREGGRPWTSRLEALRHDGVFWRRLAYLGAARGPWWFRRYTPAAFGALCFALLGERRRVVARNWRAMGLAQSELEASLGAHRTFVAFAESLTDGLESIGKGLDGYELDSPTDTIFEEAVRRGRGVILLTAHTGSWEVVGRLIGRKHKAPVTMVMTEEHNASTRAFADAIRTRYREEADFELAYVGADPLAALPLLSALRSGRIVALQFDRVPPGFASVSVPFFGLMQPFPLGPFKLAQLTGSPIVLAFTRRVGHRRYRVDIPPLIELDRRAGDAVTLRAVETAARSIEDFVRRYPSQWFHFEALSSTPAPAAG